MALFINNDNAVTISRLRSALNLDVDIESASFLMSLAEVNSLVITNVSKAANAVITFSSNHSFKAGEDVLVNRVHGTTTVNGKHTILSVTSNTIILDGVDTQADSDFENVGDPICYLLLAEEVAMTWDGDDDEQYEGTFESTLPLINKQKYLIFIEEPTLEIQIEKIDTAQIRRR